jgi:hypothetical protein
MSTLVAHSSSVNRMIPTSPDRADRLLPPHNPSVVGSIPTGPTERHLHKYGV